MALDHTKEVKILEIKKKILEFYSILDFEAIILVSEVIKGGELVNEKRAEADLPPLRMIIAGLVENESEHDKLSSTHLREIKTSKCTQENFEILQSAWNDVCSKINVSEEVRDKW